MAPPPLRQRQYELRVLCSLCLFQLSALDSSPKMGWPDMFGTIKSLLFCLFKRTSHVFSESINNGEEALLFQIKSRPVQGVAAFSAAMSSAEGRIVFTLIRIRYLFGRPGSVDIGYSTNTAVIQLTLRRH